MCKVKHRIFVFLVVLILFTLFAPHVFAGRDTAITDWYIADLYEQPFAFRYANGTMSLNQNTWNFPSSGTNLTTWSFTNDETQWYQMIHIVSNGTEGHGYCTYNNPQVSINRRRTGFPYVNVTTTMGNTFGDSDVRWACPNISIHGFDHYLATGNLDLTSYSYIYDADTDGYFWWNTTPSQTFEFVRYNVWAGRDSVMAIPGFCGCFYSSASVPPPGWHYYPN